MTTALFWVITQRVVVISYRRFGTTYRSHPQGCYPDDGTDRLSRNVPKKLSLPCVITQKSAVVSYFVAVACSHARYILSSIGCFERLSLSRFRFKW